MMNSNTALSRGTGASSLRHAGAGIMQMSMAGSTAKGFSGTSHYAPEATHGGATYITEIPGGEGGEPTREQLLMSLTQ